ncbi:actin-like ATPase domain-containing protein [Nadsonia fulvescens var. elongata DSM 6958]|uniref:Phosphotransferase n=1 Tax=Nadsonia fulvescens var. elongata DSM 6958 TaxID=857566 RepID=A0A1E3PLC5_9ASCO|nr:actin-like ATPase domain-containing protein [Nadsonia fulvescens var. elongata DSM 6958]
MTDFLEKCSSSSFSSTISHDPDSEGDSDAGFTSASALSSTSTLASSPETTKGLHKSSINYTEISSKISSISSACDLDSLGEFSRRMTKAVKACIEDANSGSMLPSSIVRMPTGKESGLALAVDLGGSTLRIAIVKLAVALTKETPVTTMDNSAKILYMTSEDIQDDIKNSDGKTFFLWIGLRIKQVADHALDNGWVQQNTNSAPASNTPVIPMGLSWSFPISQTLVSRGRVLSMGKGYERLSKSIIGWDLKDSFDSVFCQLNANISLKAIINDTIASLLSNAYINQNTRLSLIVGTGINASVYLPITSIPKYKHVYSEANDSLSPLSSAQVTAVNVELSLIAGSSDPHTSATELFPVTVWDQYLSDKVVQVPGFQPLEQMVSGRYLGEVARLVISDLILKNQIADSTLPEGFDTVFGLSTKTMSLLAQSISDFDSTDQFTYESSLALFKTYYAHPTLNIDDYKIFLKVFTSLATRAAALTAGSLVAIATIFQTNTKDPPNPIYIAYDGSMVVKYPSFVEQCQNYLDHLCANLPESRHIKLILQQAVEGTVIGAAVACILFQDEDI